MEQGRATPAGGKRVMGVNQHQQRQSTPGRKALRLAFLVWVSLGMARGVGAAVPTQIPIAPEPVGSGARALGQSAFLAVADDATAASWNPAGLIQLEYPEVSLVGAWRAVTGTPSTADNGDLYEGRSWGEGQLNFLSYAQPIEIGVRDVVVSVNYHQVYDLGIEVDRVRPGVQQDEFRSDGAISAYSLAAALSAFPDVTVGASFNWYAPSLFHGSVRSVQVATKYIVNGKLSHTYETLDDLRGYNFTFGLFWDAYQKQGKLLTLGLVCHTPFQARVNQAVSDDVNTIPDVSRLTIDFPLSLGVGLNYRFSDRLSTAFDVQWTQWSQFTHTEARLDANDDALAYRLGAEYLTFFDGLRGSVLAYRGGIFYEPRPAWGSILPVYGFSLGLGWTVKEQFSLDFAYQFRWGEGDLGGFDYSSKEHFFASSLIVYFP
jgi:long-chain fatty acid transport protein